MRCIGIAPLRSPLTRELPPFGQGAITYEPGYGGFMQHSNAGQPFAVAPHQADNRTAMLGKYLT